MRCRVGTLVALAVISIVGCGGETASTNTQSGGTGGAAGGTSGAAGAIVGSGGFAGLGGAPTVTQTEAATLYATMRCELWEHCGDGFGEHFASLDDCVAQQK